MVGGEEIVADLKSSDVGFWDVAAKSSLQVKTEEAACIGMG